jgi:hypothetical protein
MKAGQSDQKAGQKAIIEGEMAVPISEAHG